LVATGKKTTAAAPQSQAAASAPNRTIDYRPAAGSDGLVGRAIMTYSAETAAQTVWQAIHQVGSSLGLGSYPVPPAELQTLVSFSNAQYVWGAANGLPDPGLYVYETLGAALAALPNTQFSLVYAPLNNDVDFLNQIAQLVPVNSAFMFNQLHFLEGFYSAAHVPDYELVAKGAVFGLALGIEAEIAHVSIIGTSPHV
jgi:hypothetical protein